ncbi:MAG TPA: sigma-54 dependent transcriptional regulator [Pirellulales bacterium]|jgi:DNA-binding NtrC family response regulator|nr:sigma-54 dependent transcriptional regulator [Pirellulales bacterium]
MATAAAPCILVVEDGQSEREALVRVLKLEGYRVVAAGSPERAIEFINEPVDLVVSDLRLGKQSAIDLLKRWQHDRAQTPFILMTAYGDVDSAVTAMKLGAEDFLTKPVEPRQLLGLINMSLKKRRSTSASPVDAPRGGRPIFDKIIGNSRVMADVCDQAWRAAQTDSTVLILGESGTGKELFAEAIQANSPRADGPFVLVNMAAIPETLVESELFGHVKGAFTSASQNRVGRFEAAHNGTIFIDEIGDFPLSLQAKLLRVLENHTVTPVGSNHERTVDVRVVAATSRNLHRMMTAGQFREDLFYRLNVVTIHLPALRDRKDDIPSLVHLFLHEFTTSVGRQPISVSPELMQTLESLDWPGNVRQLRNCLESMIVMARGDTLTPADLPANVYAKARLGDAEFADVGGATIDSLKRAAMLRALEHFHGNRTRAAEYLGISVRTLQRKLKEWNLNVAGEQEPSDAQR